MTNYGIRPIYGLTCIALFGAACTPERVEGVRLNPALAQYIASDALAVANVHLDRLRTTPLYQHHEKDFALLNGADQSNELLFVWDGKALLSAGLGAAAKVSLSGDPRAIRAAKQARTSGTGKLPNELLPSLSWLRPSDQVWIASRGLPLEGVPLPSEYASLLSNFRGYVRATAAGLTVDSGLHLHARIDCFTDTGSRRVDDALRAGLGLMRATARGDDAELYSNIHARRESSNVYIDADLSPALSDRLLGRLK